MSVAAEAVPPSFLRGEVVWVDLGRGVGREQSGRRPAVVVSGEDYNALIDTLLLVVPVTSVDRGWPNHVRLSGELTLSKPSYAMTEQARAIARERVVDRAGALDERALAEIALWLGDFIELR